MTNDDRPDVTDDGAPRYDEPTGQYTTGHSWDGIEELNTPMPRWWLGIFYASIVFAIGYAVLMPSIPLINSHFEGLLGHSDRGEVAADLVEMRSERAVFADRLSGTGIDDITADPELFRFSMAAGKSAFGDNCATCHGTGGQGFKGYPNLNDDVWIWGGTFEDIRHTLEVGIRAAHDDTRFNIMQGFGQDGFLTRDEINDLADYILAFSGLEVDAEVQQRGQTLFADNCASCHGEDAKGDRSQGAPDLTDADWLYGGERADIQTSIYSGRQGVMPNWNERLDPEIITALAVYVHALGGGEPSLPAIVPASMDDSAESEIVTDDTNVEAETP
ncbi:Cbb3-type cytochrome c oxidase subunit CcoP [Algimonas ampicilliniresistens]|uniref:Cbb3-type cytochrome c oxidase subunit n=1 Tax=Algimonas ampicilliniresistens TaxID=1298735 RepID=A0ABQ5V5L0_9PROT|nr:cytochrome-c oxidase, cbb3-type subunit III [Algimonas ampicilliniresistens]GLQ22377.1 Cbb3-type cytochrome c oxidase subunit CcoP [Algimonas ampicilliniresistens]